MKKFVKLVSKKMCVSNMLVAVVIALIAVFISLVVAGVVIMRRHNRPPAPTPEPEQKIQYVITNPYPYYYPTLYPSFHSTRFSGHRRRH